MKKRAFSLFCAAAFASFLFAACSAAQSKETPAPVLVQESVCTLADGSSVSLWQQEALYFTDLYCLEDGAPLLECRRGSSVENVFAGELAGFQGLESAAQEAVLQYYDAQGDLFDLSALLEAAYADKLQCQRTETEFTPHTVIQETYPTGETERFTAYVTEVTLPALEDGHYTRTVQPIYTSVLFDRATGAQLSPWELFTVPEEEARQRLAGLCTEGDSLAAVTVAERIRPEWLIWASGELRVCFPAGALPSVDTAWEASLPYDDLADLLQPWAAGDAA